MAEAIYLVAAILWILVVVGAAGVGGWFAFKLRTRRRRLDRMLDAFQILALVRGRAVSLTRWYETRLAVATASKRR